MVWKPHATVAAVVERNGQFLIVEEEVENSIVYNQPAGHLEPDEDLIAAVIRETLEETAWHFVPEALCGIYQWVHPGNKACYLRFSFCGTCTDHEPDRVLDEGILNSLWLNREELLDRKDRLRSPMVLRCIDDYLEGHRYPLTLLSEITHS